MRSARTAIVTAVAALLFVLTPHSAAAPASAIAGPDGKAPTRPHSLRITAVGSYSVSLSWSASSDNSGSLSYVIQASNGYTMTVPQTSTSATFAGALFPYNTYSLFVYAVDAAGNRSSNSNTVRATLPADTTIPGTPTVTVTDIGPHHVSVSWSAADNDPYLAYFVSIDGRQIGHSTTATSGTFYVPEASTAYTVTVRARDHGINFSATSAPVTFVTDPIDTSDIQPPTTPASFVVYSSGGDLEIFLYWTQSTDNVDAQQAIRYEIYINGELAEIVIGTGSTTSYGEFGSNDISIVAIDSAGNVSEPALFAVDI